MRSLFRKPKQTSKAIAYLKVEVSSEPSDGRTIELPHADSPILKTLGNGLIVAYVVDQNDSFRYIQNHDLENEKVTEEQLHRIGLANLTNHAAKKNLRVVPHQNIFAVLLDSNFEASMILLDNLWDGPFRQFVSGQYAITVPTRDVLAFCDATSPVGLEELRTVAAMLKDSKDHPLSQSLYVREDGCWVLRDSV